MKQILEWWIVNQAIKSLGTTARYDHHVDMPHKGGIAIWSVWTNTKSATPAKGTLAESFISYGQFTVQSLKYYYENPGKIL